MIMMMTDDDIHLWAHSPLPALLCEVRHPLFLPLTDMHPCPGSPCSAHVPATVVEAGGHVQF